ncbi:MAG: 4Fe-4S binding protein [Calditrichia bacterium]
MQKELGKIIKNDIDTFPWRRVVQSGFLLMILWIGIEFIIWVHQLEQGQTPTVSRPPGVEGFLPISALISLRYWILTGVFNTIHPSALVLLLIIMGTAVFLKKGFCSWVCPVGFLSDGLAWIHKKIFDRYLKLPRWIDYPLRSLKYLLMGYFVFAVFVQMNLFDLQKFIYSPYNRVADIKMLKFFAEMSATTFWVLVTLTLLSIAIPYFWCRYLCPYGALLGPLSWLSPFKIRRNADTCIDCEKCSKVCPARINVHKAKTVRSDECHACLSCVAVCPVKDTLYLSAPKNKWKLTSKQYGYILVGMFVVGSTVAHLANRWQNSITDREYQHHIQNLNAPVYFHNRGQVADYPPERYIPQQELKKSKKQENLHE